MINKRYLWLLLIMGATISSLQGQDTPEVKMSAKSWSFPYEASVQMNDGTVFNCSVIEDSNNILQVVLTYGDTLTLDYKDISNCERRSSASDRVTHLSDRDRTDRKYSNNKPRRRLTGKLAEMPVEAFIKMENGTRYSRTILEDDTYILTTLDNNGDTSYLYYPDIEKVTKKLDNVTYYQNATYHFNRGTFFRWAMSANVNENSSFVTMELMAGMRLNKKWAVGAGYSLDFYSQNFGGINTEVFGFNNFFAYGRYNLTDKKARFFVSGKVGHAFGDLNFNNYTAGINVSPSIGFTIAARKNLRLTVEGGITSQWVEGNYTTRNWWDSNAPVVRGEYKSVMNRPFIKIGLDFQ